MPSSKNKTNMWLLLCTCDTVSHEFLIKQFQYRNFIAIMLKLILFSPSWSHVRVWPMLLGIGWECGGGLAKLSSWRHRKRACSFVLLKLVCTFDVVHLASALVRVSPNTFPCTCVVCWPARRVFFVVVARFPQKQSSVLSVCEQMILVGESWSKHSSSKHTSLCSSCFCLPCCCSPCCFVHLSKNSLPFLSICPTGHVPSYGLLQGLFLPCESDVDGIGSCQ